MDRRDVDAVEGGEGGESRDSLNGLIEEELQRPVTIRPERLERAIPVYDHLFLETKTIVLGQHVKKICVRCGLESFHDVRSLSQRVKCTPRALAPDQVAELEEREEPPVTDGAHPVVYLLFAVAVCAVAAIVYFLARTAGH
jgi:hypothetical protein